MHGACGGSQACTAGVLKLFSGLQQGLVAYHPQPFDFFVNAVGVVHAPRSGDDLSGYVAFIDDRDGVREGVQMALWLRLLGQVLGKDVDLKFVIWHERILTQFWAEALSREVVGSLLLLLKR